MRGIELVGIGLVLICGILIYFITSWNYSNLTKMMFKVLSLSIENRKDLDSCLELCFGEFNSFLKSSPIDIIKTYLSNSRYSKVEVVEKSAILEITIYDNSNSGLPKSVERDFFAEVFGGNVLINYYVESELSQSVYIEYKGEK